MRNLQITQAITNRDTPAVERYFNDVGQEPLISGQEEVLLAQRIRQGDRSALEKLIKANLRFVVSVAKRYQNQGLPLSDLISEGNIGLVRAAHRFDETRGFKFISCAVWWIRQSILDALSEQTRTIRLPRNHVNMLTKINNQAGLLENRLERSATQEELAEFFGVQLDKLKTAEASAPRTLSFDAPVSCEDATTMLEKISNGEHTVDEQIMAEHNGQFAAGLLKMLSMRERAILEMTFGFYDQLPMLPTEIGPLIGLTGERVRQIRNNALDKLRAQAEKHKPYFMNNLYP
jgi:RNA polymerase primary sigma factor